MKCTIYILLLFLFSTGCKEPFDREAYLDTKLKETIQEFMAEENDKCRLRTDKDATLYIDSIISQWIKVDMLDSIEFPNKPFKPNRPEAIIDEWLDPASKKFIDSLLLRRDSLMMVGDTTQHNAKITSDSMHNKSDDTLPKKMLDTLESYK